LGNGMVDRAGRCGNQGGGGRRQDERERNGRHRARSERRTSVPHLLPRRGARSDQRLLAQRPPVPQSRPQNRRDHRDPGVATHELPKIDVAIPGRPIFRAPIFLSSFGVMNRFRLNSFVCLLVLLWPPCSGLADELPAAVQPVAGLKLARHDAARWAKRAKALGDANAQANAGLEAANKALADAKAAQVAADKALADAAAAVTSAEQ